MKRTDRMVGIDGTAQGRMNSSDSHLIHQRCVHEEARQHQRDHHLDVDRDEQEHERVDDRAEEDRVLEQLDVALRMARQPEPVAHRIQHEDQEDQQVGRDQDAGPRICQGGQRASAPDRRARAARRVVR